jgi:hypothetical protein
MITVAASENENSPVSPGKRSTNLGAAHDITAPHF